MQAKILLAALIALAFTASPAAADTFTVDGLTADTYGHPTNGRVFMFHAMNGTRAHDENQGSVIDGLVVRGYQVIAPDEPFDGSGQASRLRAAFRADSTAGRSYRDQWTAYTRHLIAAADTTYGPASRLLMAGQSWGGWSALAAACDHPEVDGYIVTVPLTDPHTYAPFADLPLDGLKLDGCVGPLRQMTGFVAWGDADGIALPAPTRRLVNALGPYATTSCEYERLGHESSLLAYAGMVRWVDGARDCLPWPTVAAPVVTEPAAATPDPVSAPTAVAPAPVRATSRCNRAHRCESIVRRGKLFHVYNRRSKHPRWVYVRKARR